MRCISPSKAQVFPPLFPPLPFLRLLFSFHAFRTSHASPSIPSLHLLPPIILAVGPPPLILSDCMISLTSLTHTQPHPLSLHLRIQSHQQMQFARWSVVYPLPTIQPAGQICEWFTCQCETNPICLRQIGENTQEKLARCTQKRTAGVRMWEKSIAVGYLL